MMERQKEKEKKKEKGKGKEVTTSYFPKNKYADLSHIWHVFLPFNQRAVQYYPPVIKRIYQLTSLPPPIPVPQRCSLLSLFALVRFLSRMTCIQTKHRLQLSVLFIFQYLTLKSFANDIKGFAVEEMHCGQEKRYPQTLLHPWVSWF